MLRILIFALVAFVSSRSFPADAQNLSRNDALAIAVSTAKAHGIDFKNYKRDTFGRELSKDHKEWRFSWLCAPDPPPPGCEFMVVVNRATGVANYFPGM